MKLSIIIPVLNSHEVLRRHFLHFEKMGIGSDTEIIIVDDGSEPPLKYEGSLPVTILKTNDKRPWTWAIARNAGAKIANGEYLLMYDVDHIIRKDTIDFIRKFNGHKVYFEREFGVLLEDGTFTQDVDTLVDYGFPINRLGKKGMRMPQLPNNFAIKKELFFELGGYREDLIGRPYPQGEDSDFKAKWHRWCTVNPVLYEKKTIYMFPNGYYCGDIDFNPFGLFHKLTRANNRNPRFINQRRTK